MAESKKHLLLVEDEAPLREALAERLAEHGFEVEQAESGERAIEQLAEFAFDIVVTDLRLPGLDGTRVIETALLRYPDIVGIIVTGYGTVKDAVEAIKRGATDFVTKPFQFDELLHALNSALEKRKLKAENAYLRSQLQERYKFEGLIGRSPAMRALFQLLETVSASASTILVTGETGTGKEVVARAIHHNSPRRAQRFVALNCGAIPETLLEAELFGHVRGAFTGAIGTRQGRLEQAHKGTLFMDEVGTMSPGMQMKLLRVLQERKYRRLGGVEEMEAAMRVITATNQDLTKMIADGKFREDLFYRINVIPIHLPPLRERGEDIPLLADYFLTKYRDQMGKSIHGISQESMDLLEGYEWPGNIRELENVVERAVALEKSQAILPDSLPEHIQKRVSKGSAAAGLLPESGFNLEEHVEGLERGYITQALQRAGGVQIKAAELLGIPYRSFRYYVKKYNLR